MFTSLSKVVIRIQLNSQMKRYKGKVCVWGGVGDAKRRSVCPCGAGLHHPLRADVCARQPAGSPNPGLSGLYGGFMTLT